MTTSGTSTKQPSKSLSLRGEVEGWGISIRPTAEGLIQLEATTPTGRKLLLHLSVEGKVMEVHEGDLVRVVTGNLTEIVLGDAIRRVAGRTVHWSGDYAAINATKLHLQPQELRQLTSDQLPQQLEEGKCPCPSPSSE